MKGYQLPNPCIRFKDYANLRGGAITNRGELFRPHNFVNWVFVYSKFGNQDYYEAADAENYLR